MRGKRFATLIAAVALAVVVVPAAAQSPSAPAASVAPEPSFETAPYVPIVSKGFQHQFWQAVKKGAEDEGKVLNVKTNFIGPETEAQVDKQMEMLQAEFDKNPQAICFAALDSKAAGDLLNQAQSKNIPVIGFDSGVEPFVPVTTVATDNSKAGAVAADKIGEAIGGSGKVGLIVQDQVAQSATSRRDGFLAEIKAKYPNITIVGPQYGGGDIQKSADIAKAMITANPDIKAIFGTNEGGAEGAVQGVKEAGKGGGKVLVAGYDSGKAQIDGINAGDEMGAITQNPVGIGQQCVIAAVKAIQGISQPATIDTGFYWYDKTNITDPKIVADLYQ